MKTHAILHGVSERFQRHDPLYKAHINPHPDFPNVILVNFHGIHSRMDDGVGTIWRSLAWSLRQGILSYPTPHAGPNAAKAIEQSVSFFHAHGLGHIGGVGEEYLVYKDVAQSDPLMDRIRMLPLSIQHAVFGSSLDDYIKAKNGKPLRFMSEIIPLVPAQEEFLRPFLHLNEKWLTAWSREEKQSMTMTRLLEMIDSTFSDRQKETILLYVPHPVSFGSTRFHRFMMWQMGFGDVDGVFPVEVLDAPLAQIPMGVEVYNGTLPGASNTQSALFSSLGMHAIENTWGGHDGHSAYTLKTAASLLATISGNSTFLTSEDILRSAKHPNSALAISGWGEKTDTEIPTLTYWGLHKAERHLSKDVKHRIAAMTDVRTPAFAFLDGIENHMPMEQVIYSYRNSGNTWIV